MQASIRVVDNKATCYRLECQRETRRTVVVYSPSLRAVYNFRLCKKCQKNHHVGFQVAGTNLYLVFVRRHHSAAL